MIKLTLLMFSLILLAFPAHALRVSNFTDQPQTITVDYYGETLEAVIAPYQKRQFYGRPRELSKGDQTITLIHIDNEYAIRKSGRLSLQRRNYNDRRGR